LADLDRVGGDWFAVLPDCAAADAAAQLFATPDRQVVRHPSGRPWLVGRWPAARLAVAGGTALLGHQHGTGPDPPGSYHVVSAAGPRVRVRGTASGFRRVCYARVHGVVVASDQARVLAAAIGAGPDPAAVAGRLFAPMAPHPLPGDSLWQGVVALPPDHELTVDGDGPARTRRWWRAPDPAGPLAGGAAQLRERLRAAIGVRVQPGQLVSADLSGGVDSTALCFLAAEQGADLVTVRIAPVDPASDDPAWASRAAELLPGEHLVVDPATVWAQPLRQPEGSSLADLTDLADLADLAEEPVGGLLTRMVLGHTAGLVRERGSGLHLAGYGGDEVSGVSRAYLRDLLPHRPGQVLRHLRGHRALRRWSLAVVVRALSDRRSYPQWLVDTAAEVRDPALPDGAPQFGWGGAARLPPWATPAAVELVRDRLARAAREAEPLAGTRAQHRAVAAVWSAAHAARQLGRAMPGVELAVPYFDDQVVAAALAVDLAERGTPWRYKPLLAEAVRPVMAALPERTTKARFTADGIAGLRRHRAELAALCDDLRLARLGLVDAEGLRAAFVGLDPTGRVLMAAEHTLSAELWLREATGGRIATA
jgi:asparagine synthase (glutamine-hydrolysing)